MAITLVIGTKSGKSYQKKLTKEESESLYGKKLGDEFNGEVIGLTGVKFIITGGSDADGFPMRKDLPGIQRKRILLTRGVGFRGKLKGKRFKGLRVKKSVAGNTVFEKTHQLNVKVISGEDKVVEAFKSNEEENKTEE